DRLADDDQAIRPLTGHRLIVDLGHVLPDSGQGLELTLADDLILDLLGALSGRSFGRVSGWSLQLGPGRCGPVLGQGLEIGPRVDAKEERHVLGVPGVELLRLGEVRVTAEGNPAEAGLAAEQ